MSIPNPHSISTLAEFECELDAFRRDLESKGFPKAEIVYRGLADGLELTTTLDRAIDNWDLSNKPNRALIERQLIRDFRRGYQGPDVERVLSDTCYCLALMQHHGAPTRMLDWTYSPYIAAKFALEKRRPGAENKGPTQGVVWCLNTDWLHRTAAMIVGELALSRWNGQRNERWFRRLFMSSVRRRNFVYTANPFNLNERLRVQQGVFLCQGNVADALKKILEGMDGHEFNIRLIELDLNREHLHEFGERLWRMNIISASLFPGLDGYAKSLGENPRMFTGNTNTNRN